MYTPIYIIYCQSKPCDCNNIFQSCQKSSLYKDIDLINRRKIKIIDLNNSFEN